MSLQQRLLKLELKSNQPASEGLPLRPLGMSDDEYNQAIIDKRRELKLKDNEQLSMLSLCTEAEGEL